MQPPNREATGPVPLLLESYRWPVRGGATHTGWKRTAFTCRLMETAAGAQREMAVAGR